MLNENQYSTSRKYEARIYLHKRFKTNAQSKYEWIFKHFPQSENLKILELGCGTGLFWLVFSPIETTTNKYDILGV
jgi:cyclopropane fatty-acyl-phospholipid synthase-like methyltransferase